MTPTTVACVWVRGHVAYPVEYVTRLEATVARWMDRTYRFVCLTDRPGRLPKGVEPAVIPTPVGHYAWWSKLQLFNRALPLGGRVLYLDLDTLPVAPLAPLLDYPAPFALVPHAGAFEGLNGRRVVKRFNSSVMVYNAGEQAALFEEWRPDVTLRLWGDQDWIGERAPDAATFPAAWCPRLSELGGSPPVAPAVVVLSKKPKNLEAARRWSWFDAAWGAARRAS
jgi:hypothetical protein